MKRYLGILLAVIMMVMMIFTASADEEKVLTMWYWDNATYSALFDAFKEETGADFTIEFVDVSSGDYTTKFLTNLASGAELPDIVSLEIGYRQRLMDIDGLLEVITEEPYNYDPSLVADYIPALLTNHNGDIVCIDGQTMGSGVAYKRELAKQYLGTDDPDALAEILPDWDAVAEYGEKIYEESNGEVYLFASVSQIYLIISGQATTAIMSVDGEINSEEVARRLEILKSLKEHHVYDPESFGAANDFDISQTYSADNHIMYACAPWCPRYVIKPNDPDRVAGWGIMLAPGGGFSWGGLATAVLSTSQYKEEAWSFLEWANMTISGANWQLVNAGEVSNLKEFLTNSENFAGQEDEYFGGQNVKEMFAKICLEIKGVLPLTRYDEIVTTAMNNALLTLVTEDDVDIDDLVETVVGEIEYVAQDL